MLLTFLEIWLFKPIWFFIKLALWALALIFVGAFVFLIFFDLNSMRTTVDNYLSNTLGVTFRTYGDIKPGVEGVHPSIVLNNIHTGIDGKTVVSIADKLEITVPQRVKGEDNAFSIRFNLENYAVGQHPLGNYAASVVLSPAGFDIPDLEGALDQATMKANVRFHGGVFKMEAKGADIDYGHLAIGAKGGKAGLDARLEGQGITPDQMIKSLSGKVVLKGGAGEMSGNVVDFWGGNLFSTLLKGQTSKTKVNCVLADFDVKGGVATSENIVIDTENVAIFGRGNVDLVKGHIDMVFTPRPKTASLITLATPVIVEGPLGKVNVRPSREAVMNKLGGLMLGAINPAAALLPLMSAGTTEGKGSLCDQADQHP